MSLPSIVVQPRLETCLLRVGKDRGSYLPTRLSIVLTCTSVPSDDDSGALEQSNSAQPTSTDFNTDFSSWLPRYQKPAHPCEYCRSRSLECFVYNSDGSKQTGCSPYRISASLSSMARCSACLTAICSRSDSQEHSGYGGALQMAQFGDASISRVKAWRASANHRRSRVGQARLGSCLKTRYAGRVRLRCGVSSV